MGIIKALQATKIDRKRAAARLRLRISDLLHAALTESGMKKADLGRALGVDRSAVTQIIEGNGNITVNTLAEYLATLGYEVDLAPVELGEIVASMREHRAPRIQEITQRDQYRNPQHLRLMVAYQPDVRTKVTSLQAGTRNSNTIIESDLEMRVSTQWGIAKHS